jgi:hypothetical protein
MRIEIVDKEGNEITSFNLESNPFKIGETINISVSNFDKEFWTVKEINGEFKVDKIEHFIRQTYGRNHRDGTAFTVSVEVSEIE